MHGLGVAGRPAACGGRPDERVLDRDLRAAQRVVHGRFRDDGSGVAVAVFAFLPYCQIAGLNVTADIFTARASRFWLSLFSFLGAAIALGFGAFMLWRMYYGMIDQITFEATTAILQIPLWWGFAACAASLALLVVASFASLVDALHGMARG
jgi:TRAP-type C4-dicarboxylate transport system permease small subunit